MKTYKYEIKFNGSENQNKWAGSILANAKLTPEQIDNLLRYGGPKMHTAGVIDVEIIIAHRHNLITYADSLGQFYKLTAKEKHAVACEAIGSVAAIARAAGV